jgi:hypothetical protein
MRITRRRKRRPDAFASADWVRSIFDQLKATFPLLSSLKENDLIKLCRSVRHVERYTATDTRRGRPSRWPREDLVKVASKLTEILSRETHSRMSLATFVDHYLRTIDFPADVTKALALGTINLFEAEQLARITGKRLGISVKEAERKRVDTLSAHLNSKESGERLRRRVNELVSATGEGGVGSDAAAGQDESVDGLEDFDPYDSTHLFWEQIKQLGFAFREIGREDVTDEEIQLLIEASEPVWNVLLRIQRRKERKAADKLIF